MIEAKPVVADQHWILTKGDRKIGSLARGSQGYQVRMQDRTATYRTLRMLRKHLDIDFYPVPKPARPAVDQVHGFHTGCRAHNGMWHVQHRLPLFTKTEKSRSWYAAGWYAIKQHRSWRITRNPKLIVLERYAFQGPYHSQEEASVQVRS